VTEGFSAESNLRVDPVPVEAAAFKREHDELAARVKAKKKERTS
jgi:hypothetical protein